MLTFIVVVLVTLALTAVLFPFTANALAKLGWFYTTLESGDIKFIMRGETLRKTIYDLPAGKDIKCVNKGNGFKKSWFNKRYGLYWTWIPPFGRVHKFLIVKERENPDGETPEKWITRDSEETTVSSLRFTFSLPFVLKAVELKDRIPVDLLVTVKVEVEDPYIPVFIFKGKVSRNANGIIRAGVSDVVKRYDLDEFVAKDKGEAAGGMLFELKAVDSALNAELVRQTGLRLVGISISQYDPSDKEIRTAMNAQAITLEQNKALVAAAQGHADQLAIRVKADAAAVKAMGEARGDQIRETVAAMASTLGSPDVVARGVAELLEMEAAAGEKSKITTLVKSNGAPPPVVIPTTGGGDK